MASLPTAARNATVDLDAVFDQYRRGVPVKRIAESIGRGPDWVSERVRAAGVERDAPMRRAARPSRFPELDDPEWLRARLAEAGISRIANELGTSRSNVSVALARHGIEAPPQRTDRRARITSSPDPVVRYGAAGKLLEEAEETARWAHEQQAAAVREMVEGGLSVGEIAGRLDITATTVRALSRS